MKKTMKRAHEIKNAAAAKFNCKPSEIVFSICLEMAWGEVRMRKTETQLAGETKVINNVNRRLEAGGDDHEQNALDYAIGICSALNSHVCEGYEFKIWMSEDGELYRYYIKFNGADFAYTQWDGEKVTLTEI